MPDPLTEATKDELILAMLAVLGGETREVNERDLFLASWHAFPNTMRWVDTALPNPDTFTASLRRLDQRGFIERVGKQQRQTGRRRTRRKSAVDAGRSGVVKARVAEGGLERAGVGPDLVEEVRRLRPDSEATGGLSAGGLIAICVGMRETGSRTLDEGALAELAFHKFPERFSYVQRPEFPDLERIRAAVRAAVEEGLIDDRLALSDAGRALSEEWRERLRVRLDASDSYKAGDLKIAARIEESPAYRAWAEHGTLVRSKPDELFRALRLPPTTDPRPVAAALASRSRALARIDKGELVEFLTAIARRHNPDVAAFIDGATSAEDQTAGVAGRSDR